FPWKGNDRYPNNARPDKEPYCYLPGEQALVDKGNAYGGIVASLYNAAGTDSVFVDWASSGGTRNWGQYSVVSLIGKKGGKDFRFGSLEWEYNVDASGKLTFGARPASDADVKTWMGALDAGYLATTYGGDVK